MKKNRQPLHILLIFIFFAIYSNLQGQAPSSISYQAIVRSTNNELLKNTQIGMRISILKGYGTKVVVYQETQSPRTNSHGLVNIKIGEGETNNSFQNIEWGKDTFYIKTEIDPSGGDVYLISSISELSSVPYSFYASIADSVENETDPLFRASPAMNITNDQIVAWNAISEGDTIIIREEISRIDTIVHKDTVVLATDTLVIREVLSHIDTVINLFYDTIVLAADTLVIFETYSRIDTVVSVVYDTTRIETIVTNKDTIVFVDSLYHFDTLLVFEQMTIYDSLLILQYDTIVEMVPDTSYRSSPASGITADNIISWNSKLDNYTESDPEYSNSAASLIRAEDIASSIRQVQAYGLGVKEFGAGSGIFPGYGIYFKRQESVGVPATSYILYADGIIKNLKYDTGEKISELPLQGAAVVDDICADQKQVTPGPCDINYFYVEYLRPQPSVSLQSSIGGSYSDVEVRIKGPNCF